MQISNYFLTILICMLSVLAIGFKTNANSPRQEFAMADGMRIEATNDNGTISIFAKTKLIREYSFGEKRIQIKMRPREKRWLGSLGIYSPGGGTEFHVVAEEGQQHFCSEREALEWLTWQNELMKYVFTPDGLVVGWYTTKDPHSSQIAMGVKIWQIYINGKSPKQLTSSMKMLVEVSNVEGEPIMKPPVGDFIASKPRIINGRLYSGKALDYMSESGVNILPNSVEETIAQGKFEKVGKYITYYLFDDAEDLLWVKIDEVGRIILIGR